MRSVGEIVVAARARWRFVFGAAFAASMITAIVVLILPPRYTAVTRFMADAPSKPGLEGAIGGLAGSGGLGGIAALLGGGGSAQSPMYYAAILRSRTLLKSVVEDKYPPAGSSDSANLLVAWAVKGKSDELRLDNGLRKLLKRSNVSVDRVAGMVIVSVEDESPALAAEVANRLVLHVDRFNQERRRTRANRQRVFVEGRAKETLAALAESEDALRNFEDGNRSWRTAASLSLAHDRLDRQVQVNREVYLTLRRELETSRIDEVNDTPVLTVVDAAEPPVRKSYPQRTMSVLLAFFMTFAFAVVIVAGLTPGAPIPGWIAAWDRLPILRSLFR